MAEIIASTYEVLSRIGAGGGGVVYLARHLRLNTLVVLKADRRKLSTPPEALRREVDSLKDLTHQYLPKVYDFISENGVVYTVMDYIEGESLDKPLKRGEIFSQPDVIRMADQLLRALVYLHSRPPHGILHADIKPANIMRTPQGDIRLIDFNIALALGEKGAVRVGLSRGYASPEHYDSDHSAGPITRGLQQKEAPPPAAESESEEATEARSAEPEESRTSWNGAPAARRPSSCGDEYTAEDLSGTMQTEETGTEAAEDETAEGTACETVPNRSIPRAVTDGTVTEEETDGTRKRKNLPRRKPQRNRPPEKKRLPLIRLRPRPTDTRSCWTSGRTSTASGQPCIIF